MCFAMQSLEQQAGNRVSERNSLPDWRIFRVAELGKFDLNQGSAAAAANYVI